MPILGDFLDLKDGSLSEIMDAIWAYIKKERLQDSSDKRNIRKDPRLACVSKYTEISITCSDS